MKKRDYWDSLRTTTRLSLELPANPNPLIAARMTEIYWERRAIRWIWCKAELG